MTWRQLRRKLQNIVESDLDNTIYYLNEDYGLYPLELHKVESYILDDEDFDVDQYCDEGDLIFV